YYRLNVIPIRLPPLRERIEDIPLLAAHFLQKFNTRLNKSLRGISEEAEAVLMGYPWHGNIRELENVIERAVLFADGARIEISDIPMEVRERFSTPRPRSSMPPAAGTDDATTSEGLKERVKAAMTRLEKELIQRALDQTSGNVTHAARLLKISRKGLQLKMKELGLREREDRADL
ncbi:MAG TPA: helix-turn-helix domain-containing protein, partial [Polyangiaceae bacterium]|nr:helix-turn-helix domain-containing protein [Polyangiaceae bacterium]